MRWLVLGSLLACGFVIFVAVAAVTSGPAKDPDAYELHAPETDEEKEVARVAVEYIRWLEHRREVFVRGELGVEHVGVREDGTATVWLTNVEPGPGHSVSLRRVDGRWRGVSHSAFGLA